MVFSILFFMNLKLSLVCLAEVHSSVTGKRAFTVPIERSGPAPLPWENSLRDKSAKEVTLRDVFSSVEKHLPLTTIALKQVEIAEGRATAAKGAFDFRLQGQLSALTETYDQHVIDTQLARQIDGTPLELYAGWRRGTGDFRPYEGKQLTGDNGEIRGGVKVPLLRDLIADPARTRRSVTQSLLRSSQEDAKFKILDLKRVASDRYWDWVESILQLEAVLRLYRLADERVDQVRRRASAGSAAKIEVVEIERMIVQRKAQLIEAERVYQKSTLDLSLYYRDQSGVPQVEMFLPKDFNLKGLVEGQQLNLADVRTVIRNALKNRKDILAIDEQLLAAEKEASLTKNQILPRLDAQVEYAADSGAPKKSEKELRGILTLSFPLENREARGNLTSAQARVDQVRQSKVFLRDQITQEVVNFQSVVKAAYLKAKAMVQDQELSEKLAQAERQRFKDGLSSLLIVNIREQNANDSAIKALDALVEYEKSKVRYEISQGFDPGR